LVDPAGWPTAAPAAVVNVEVDTSATPVEADPHPTKALATSPSTATRPVPRISELSHRA
jgi:hypothetical protein